MATSGSKSVKVTNYDTLKFSWERSSYSTDNNTSIISWKMQLISTGSGAINSSSSKSWAVTVNGTKYSGTNTVGIAANSTKTLASDETTIKHNNDGSKTFSYSFSQSFSGISFSGTTLGTVSGSGSGTLDEIARKATITAAVDFTDEDNPTITYKNPAGSSVSKLEVCISLTGANDDIVYREISKSSTSYQFNLTTAERKVLRAATTTSNSRNVRFYIKTTIGDSTYLQYVSKKFTVINNKPTIAPVVEDIDSVMLALTGDSSKFIKYYSNPAYTMNAAALKEATIKSVKATCGGTTRTTQSGEFYNIESNTISFSVTDSRGNTTNKNISLSMINYIKLTCNIDAKIYLDAADNTKAAIEFTASGNYFNGSFGKVANSLTLNYVIEDNNGNKTAAALTIPASAISGGKYTVSNTVTDLDYRNSYIVTVTAADAINKNVVAISKTLQAIPIFDWGASDFNLNVALKLKNKTVLRNNGDNNNIILSAENATNGVFIRPNGTGSAEGQAIFNTDGSLTLNGIVFNKPKILWSSTGIFMNKTQTANLSEPISKQANGIVLVFSGYSNGSVDYNWHTFFIPKLYATENLDVGGGTCFMLCSSNFSLMATKYLYINDTSIGGNENNDTTGTGASGITYSNNRFVMRYVLGV